MNKTAIFITVALCLTAIFTVLIVTTNGDKEHPADLAEQLVKEFEKEYGVKATVQLEVEDSSEREAESLTNRFAEETNGITGQDELEVGEDVIGWYTAIDDEKGISLRVYFNN